MKKDKKVLMEIEKEYRAGFFAIAATILFIVMAIVYFITGNPEPAIGALMGAAFTGFHIWMFMGLYKPILARFEKVYNGTYNYEDLFDDEKKDYLIYLQRKPSAM